jgi:hypothetical protein
MFRIQLLHQVDPADILRGIMPGKGPLVIFLDGEVANDFKMPALFKIDSTY